MTITAAILAEICSALPVSGSIYIWAAESAGPKYARFFGFVVAWWSCTAWMTFTAGNCQVRNFALTSCQILEFARQTTANYLVSQLAVWEIEFPGGISNTNVKWRAFIWAVSEGFLLLAVAINYLPPRLYSAIFKFSIALIMLDFLLCLIWLPIGVSRTYGFRSAKDVFTMTCMSVIHLHGDLFSDDIALRSDNGTGAPAGWNWILSLHVFYLLGWVGTYFYFNSLFTAGTLTGFDASGHVAEETKNARVIAGKGILSSCVATGVLGFITVILFLFCTPDFGTLFSLNAPQPFVLLYALALGRSGSAFMTAIAVIGLTLVRDTKDLPKDHTD